MKKGRTMWLIKIFGEVFEAMPKVEMGQRRSSDTASIHEGWTISDRGLGSFIP